MWSPDPSPILRPPPPNSKAGYFPEHGSLARWPLHFLWTHRGLVVLHKDFWILKSVVFEPFAYLWNKINFLFYFFQDDDDGRIFLQIILLLTQYGS
jgi:hypothetical protein